MESTSVTAVLIGSNTFERRWVGYELARSVIKGNGIVCVKVHRLQNQLGYPSTEGLSPFDYLGVYRLNDGRILLAEWKDGRWVRYGDYTEAVTLPKNWSPFPRNSVAGLSNYAQTYCYDIDQGANTFSSWVHAAATAA